MSKYSKNGILYKEFSDVTVGAKADSDNGGNGFVEGYMATFNNVDQFGDRVLPGAFKKTISERVNGKKVSLMVRHFAHGGDFTDEVALVTEAREDKKGLWFRAEFLSVPEAQNVRQRLLDRQEKGFNTPFSIGYRVIEGDEKVEKGARIFELKELALMEGTITLRPVNEKTRTTRAKSAEDTSLEGTNSNSQESGVVLEEKVDFTDMELALDEIDTFLKETDQWTS